MIFKIIHRFQGKVNLKIACDIHTMKSIIIGKYKVGTYSNGLLVKHIDMKG